jgi:DNA-binding NtrC family response regulator
LNRPRPAEIEDRIDMDRRLEILVVDDEEVVCTRLKPALEKDGYYVETFTESTLAKKRIEKHRFDIVVTDIKMAAVDGMELLTFVREKWPKTRVIVISGFTTVEMTREAFQAGVCDVLAKPFKIRQLKELIDKVALEIRGDEE